MVGSAAGALPLRLLLNNSGLWVGIKGFPEALLAVQVAGGGGGMGGLGLA